MTQQLRALAVLLLFASPSLAKKPVRSATGTVTITSPASGSSVTSPVHVTASATSNYPISTMAVSVDSAVLYTVAAATVDTYLKLSAGTHHLAVQATNSVGGVYTSTVSVTVVSSSGSSLYQNNFTGVSNWLAASLLPDGAINSTGNQIEPYFSNLGAIGLVRDPARYGLVQGWMQWYIGHMNYPDRWGLNGTVYVYNVDPSTGVETNTYTADSTDSYAGTFLTLAYLAYQTGDPNLQSYVKSLYSQLDTIAQVIVQTQQSDGLTWALPDYQVKYLMDNCEAYRGLRDAAQLFQIAFNDSAKAAYYNNRAAMMYNGIQGLWMGAAGFSIYKDNGGNLLAPNLATWYPDATSQVFPVLQGVIPAADPKAQQVYSAFNAAWPGWPNLSFNSQDPFPWVLVGDAAAAMGDSGRVTTYINTVTAKFVNTGYPSPWDSEEAGFWMRVNSYMYGQPW